MFTREGYFWCYCSNKETGEWVYAYDAGTAKYLYATRILGLSRENSYIHCSKKGCRP